MKKNKPKKRALLLFSGGLDSILAAKILEKQGIEVTALTFVSCFFGAAQAKKSARENKIRLRVADISEKHFQIVKKPRFGRGVGMNPCIDCHLLMLKAAKKIAEREKFDIITTGEVLGQRPMSQNAKALELIEREAGLAGKILRPLSAKILPVTQAERTQIIDRELLYSFRGKNRKGQIELAKKMGVKNYPSPAGGCILTDKEYSKKLGKLIKEIGKIRESDLKLLRLGRHFWLGKSRIILGRNYEENLAIKKLSQKGDILVDPKNFPGPTALVRGKDKKAGEKFAKEKILKYAKKAKDKKPEFKISKAKVSEKDF